MYGQRRFLAFLLVALCGLLPVMFVANDYYDELIEARAERDEQHHGVE